MLVNDRTDRAALDPVIRRRARLGLLVLAIVSLLPLAWTVQAAWVRIAQPNPQSPWEAEILTDAWRARHGLRVYSLPAEDHATHMYGPLITYVVAPFARSNDLNFRVPRFIALGSSIALTLALSIGLTRRLSGMTRLLVLIIAICLLLTQFYRTRVTIAESRPDAVAAAFAGLAVWLFYLGQTRSAIFGLLGIVAMLIGFFFKQTAAAVAVIPLAAMFFARPVRMSWLVIVPPVVMGLTILVLRVWFPDVYFYVVKVPTLFRFRFDAWPLEVIKLITTNVLFDIALILWLAGMCASSVSRSATAWILAAVLVLSISCGAAVAKLGGKNNSYLAAFIAMAAFSIAILPDLLAKVSSLVRSRAMQLVATAFLSLMLIADATSVEGTDARASSVRAYGDKHYKQIVKRVRKLHGRVVCLDDPTIPLKAKGYLGRNIVVELDAIGWHGRPAYLTSDLKRADYTIRVDGVWTSQVTDKELKRLGFKAVSDPAFAKTGYFLYRRAKSDALRHQTDLR